MICLRCGYCCVNYEVSIVSPEAVAKYGDDLDLETDNFEYYKEIIVPKHTGDPCPHLSMVGGKVGCALHDRPWYHLTPCYQHTQIERGNTPCRMGEAIADGKIPAVAEKLKKDLKEILE